MREKRRRPSLAEVAGEAGVSISTVSKVVNGAPDVAAATRVRVESVLRDKQYLSPKQRSRGDLATVVVVLASSSMSSPLTVEILRGTMRRGLDTRVGLEDTLTCPDGMVVADNAALLRAVLA